MLIDADVADVDTYPTSQRSPLVVPLEVVIVGVAPPAYVTLISGELALEESTIPAKVGVLVVVNPPQSAWTIASHLGAFVPDEV